MFGRKKKKIEEYFEITEQLANFVNVDGVFCPLSRTMFSNRREYGRAVIAWAYAVQNSKEAFKKKK